jgi:hypothetical protein
MVKYDSHKKLPMHDIIVSDVDDDEVHYNTKSKKHSPERVTKLPGAGDIYDREITVNQHKLMMKAKRKDLKSATA